MFYVPSQTLLALVAGFFASAWLVDLVLVDRRGSDGFATREKVLALERALLQERGSSRRVSGVL